MTIQKKTAAPVEAPVAESVDRSETYTATRSDGSVVTVTRNIETGETKVK